MRNCRPTKFVDFCKFRLRYCVGCHILDLTFIRSNFMYDWKFWYIVDKQKSMKLYCRQAKIDEIILSTSKNRWNYIVDKQKSMKLYCRQAKIDEIVLSTSKNRWNYIVDKQKSMKLYCRQAKIDEIILSARNKSTKLYCRREINRRNVRVSWPVSGWFCWFKSCQVSSVTRLGKISPFGRIFSEKYRPNDVGAILNKTSPQIYLDKL
jgi:hypothetical protein